jgi:hypothetical protein
MVNYQYTYLLMGLIFAIFWVGLFIWRKDTRKEMLVMSTIFSIAGPLADILYTKDWWRPLTLTGTPISFEAFFVGFVIGGIASVVYENLFKKKVKIRNTSPQLQERRTFHFGAIVLLALILFFGAFYILKFDSLWSTIFALFIPTIIMWIQRKDLILDSIVTGVTLLIVAGIVYSLLEIITPGWVSAFWVFENVPNKIIFNIPLDDIIWYFLAGMFIGPLYEYWQEGRLVDAK